MSEQELIQVLASEGLSNNFGGDDVASIVMDSYTGDGDLSIDFGETSGFAEAGKSGRKYTMKIVNKTGLDRNIVLFPAHFDTQAVVAGALVHHSKAAIVAANFAVDAVVADGIIYADATTPAENLVVSSPDFAIRDFINYAKYNPMLCHDFIIEANDKSVFPDYIREFSVNPFSQAAERKIPVTDYLKVENNQDKKINVPEGLLFSSSSLIIFKMPGTVNGTAHTELKLTFNIGAIMNPGITLARKNKLAKRNISKAVTRKKK